MFVSGLIILQKEHLSERFCTKCAALLLRGRQLFLSLKMNSLTSLDRNVPRIVPKLSGSGIRVFVSSAYVNTVLSSILSSSAFGL